MKNEDPQNTVLSTLKKFRNLFCIVGIKIFFNFMNVDCNLLYLLFISNKLLLYHVEMTKSSFSLREKKTN